MKSIGDAVSMILERTQNEAFRQSLLDLLLGTSEAARDTLTISKLTHLVMIRLSLITSTASSHTAT